MFCTKCGAAHPEGVAFCGHCGLPLRAPIRSGRSYAGFWIRLVAYLLDSVVCLLGASVIGIVLFAVLSVPLAAVDSGDAGVQLATLGGVFVLIVLAFAGGWLYYALFECSSWQATPGKRILGMKVTDLDSQPISFGRASGRFWAKLLSNIFYVGFILIGFSAQKQGLHDMIAGTLVLRR